MVRFMIRYLPHEVRRAVMKSGEKMVRKTFVVWLISGLLGEKNSVLKFKKTYATMWS